MKAVCRRRAWSFLFITCLTAMAVLLLLTSGNLLEAAGVTANPNLGLSSLRLEIEGVGTLLACPPNDDLEGGSSQLLLQKPGGMVEVIYSLEGQSFVSLSRGDLDGDQIPEVLAVTRNQSSDDLLPFVFSEKQGFACLYPHDDEDSSLIGAEIMLVAGKDGTSLCIRNKVDFHSFGPPLMQSEFYRLIGNSLKKTGETFSEGNHFNLKLNRAALALQRGQFQDALNGYEEVLAQNSGAMPKDAVAEALFYQAEARKNLHDFATADRLYKKVADDFPECPIAETAGKEHLFLSRVGNATPALSLYLDVSLLNIQGQGEQSLTRINQFLAANATGTLTDHLLFLKGEALVSLGRREDAIKTFQDLKKFFHTSTLLEDVEIQLGELVGSPEETDGPSTPGR